MRRGSLVTRVVPASHRRQGQSPGMVLGRSRNRSHMRQNRLSYALLLTIIGANAYPLMAQQSDVSISPSLSLPANAGTGALAGLALTLSGNPGFALRASGSVALKNTSAGALGTTPSSRPWTADVDAVFGVLGRPLGKRNRTVASYGFLGLGKSAMDTANVHSITTNWSYGVGSTVPLGAPIDLFAEWRWRVSKLVLPTAHDRPARTREVRFGISLHLARGPV
jgi:hypothetical protein